jgi:hypothetical protein
MKVTVSVHLSLWNVTRVVFDLHDSHHHHYEVMRWTVVHENLDVTTFSSTMLRSIFLDKANTWANVGESSLMRVTSIELCFMNF